MRVPKHRGGPACDLDRSMTAMVDVVFQLLVFFVLASAGRFPEHCLSTSLAAGAVTSLIPAQSDAWTAELWIRMRRDEKGSRTAFELNERLYADVAALSEALRDVAGVAPESPVVLDIEGNVPLGDVIRVYDVCRSAKFHSVNFSASPAEVSAGVAANADKTQRVTR